MEVLKQIITTCLNNQYNAIKVDLFNEVSEFSTPTLNSLLFENLTLSDEANELMFKSVHKFILRSKCLSIHSNWIRKFCTYNN